MMNFLMMIRLKVDCSKIIRAVYGHSGMLQLLKVQEHSSHSS
jgi:hypothetical protein